MVIELTSLAAALLILSAEWLHLLRCRRLGRLAFGPANKPSLWVPAVPWLRAFAAGFVLWGLLQLLVLPPKALRPQKMPEGGYRHLILALDVSPSMQLKDAGPDRHQSRRQRARDIVMSLFQRIALDQMRLSIVAVYNGARPVVIDTYDLEVVRNIVDELPLDYAFEPGKTRLLEGIKETFELAKPWNPKSTTIVVVSDGDSVPDTGIPEIPASVGQVLIIGVGDVAAGRFIDGHQSRQDSSTLRQLAMRLGGEYYDGNERHLPTESLKALADIVPLSDPGGWKRREWALGAVGAGTSILGLIPLALALKGSRWQVALGRSKALKSNSGAMQTMSTS